MQLVPTLIAIAAALILVLLAGWAIPAVLGNRRRGRSGSDNAESSAEVIEELEAVIHPQDDDASSQ